jgi:transcriptional regulator with XRE-family HTH domain
MPTDIRVRFARHLKEFRQRKGYSVSQLAERAGISRQHIRDLELDAPQKRVTIVTLEKLAKGLGVSL